MNCPKCQFENRDGVMFCENCGTALELVCSNCGATFPPDRNYCGQCGQQVVEKARKETPRLANEGERKHVTVLFSDLSGYTAMSERLDPEEVKEITGRIFGEISKIVNKYDGFIEKYAGDAILALFGADQSHEDDPMRAVRAASEIHARVEKLSSLYEEKIDSPLVMHSGINTGLVVTGELNLEKGVHGVAGDAINVAARLSSAAKAGDILVDHETYKRTQGYFQFEDLASIQLKGKAIPVKIHSFLSAKDQPQKVHRLHGLRAPLIGRTAELDQLSDAVANLRKGYGSVISIIGPAGTGKSRLVEEFKARLDLKEIQWHEGYAFPYTLNTPYFPLINLMNRAFGVEEGDPPQSIKEKIGQGLNFLAEEKERLVPYVGSLYSLKYPEIENVSPEFWKLQLQIAIQAVLGGLAKRGPTVVCFEDLHWMDPSTLALVRSLLTGIRNPILFIPTFRPGTMVLSSHQINNLPFSYSEINLKDLSPSDTLSMVESLLKTDNIPADLKRFVKDKVEGNPFYLEEALNSLIESAALVKQNGTWQVTRPITESEISPTIHGVITARVDRLERDAKRILQEASVIGRSFYYEILKRVTELRENIDNCINGLEHLDLIKAKSMQPDLEYIFKHALTQEVVYHSLLKKERSLIHERIGLVIEQLFQNRLSEFYETLAFHFKQGRSTDKAVNYLVKSGDKSLKRYAVEEAHQYYKEAYQILNKPDQTGEERKYFIDLLNKWVFAFYYRGDFKGLTEVLSAHADLAESEDDMTRVGLFYFGMGLMEWERVKFRAAYRYLHKSLEIGERIGNKQIIGYACALLAFTYAELGLLGDEAVAYGKRAHDIASTLESDHFLYFKSLLSLAHIYLIRGQSRQPSEHAKMLLEYGLKYHNIRSLVVGHTCMGYSHYAAGNFQSAIECFEKAAEISVDPFYYHLPRAMTGLSYTLLDEFEKAEAPVKEVLSYSQNIGCDIFIDFARACLGIILISRGDFSKGFKLIEEVRQSAMKSERKWLCVVAENILGNVYSQIGARTGPASLSAMAKNAGFLIKNIPFAAKRAEDNFKKAIEIAKEIGAPGLLAQSYFNLGLLCKAKNRIENAKEYISAAIMLFEECEAEGFLNQSRKEMESLVVSKVQ